MTKLQEAEKDVDWLTINLKAFNNTNRTLTNEVDWFHWNGKKLEIVELKDQYAKALQDVKAAEDEYKMSKIKGRNEKGRMEADHRNQVALAENKIKNEQQLRDINPKG
eukprot:jgi/Psemu1/42945/gm1.42945_g